MVDASRINLFLKLSVSGFGLGNGSGLGEGSGEGLGEGSGEGWGNGLGSGFGEGSGYGSGLGEGSGEGLGEGWGNGLAHGSGSGSGYCSVWGLGFGSGFGSGWGHGWKEFNRKKVFIVDSIPCVFISIKKNIAMIDIINKDLTTTKTFLAKDENFFAHGKSIKEAVEAAYKKKKINMDIESKINLFGKTFGFNSVQSNKTFFEWHHTLTGSCELGRNRFAEEKDIDLNESMTTKEFLELTKNAYGGEAIQKIIQIYTQTKE